MRYLSSCSVVFVLQVIVIVHSQNSATWDLESNELLPRDCGEDNGKRDLSREKTDIDEFPWVVLLEYTKATGENKTLCNGVLISKRYVLTAAYCVNGTQKSWKLGVVRLGEYDTSTEKDCVDSADNKSKICSNDPITIGIEEAFSHEDYTGTASNSSNDIALLRLLQDVTFSEYIKPICLPSSPIIADKSGVISAWGKKPSLTSSTSISTIKLKFKVSINDHANCSKSYESVSEITDSQICAQTDDPEGDLCGGNGGGPLMTSKENQEGKLRWTAIGITSFGPNCRYLHLLPNVYTNVASHIPWILSKIRA